MDGEVGILDTSMQPCVRAKQATHHWRWALLFIACSATVLLSFRQTLLLMVDTWYHSRTFSHCFLILPVFLYLVWIRRGSIAALKPAPSYLGLVPMGGLTLIWLLGNLGEVRVVQEFSIVSILIVLAWTILGTAIVRALIFPLLFLLFAVPFGTSLIKPLQDFTAWFVIHALTISNVPAVLENHVISLPAGEWTVAEACSGIRFLLSSVVLGTVFSFLMYQSRVRRLIFMCASVAVPILGNGLRAYGTVLLAHITNNKLAAGVDHIVYGAFFSVLIQLLLLILGLRWREKPVKRATANNPRPIDLETHNDNVPGRSALFVATTACGLILLTPLVAAHLRSRSVVATAWPDPPVIVTAPWEAAAGGDVSWPQPWRDSDRKFSQSYIQKTSRIDLSWMLYSGRSGIDLALSSDGLPNSKSWMLTSGHLASAVVSSQPITVYRTRMESAQSSRAVWTWYWVSGEYTASRTRVRFLQAKARLSGKPSEVAIINLGVDNRTDLEAERTLQDFLLHASFQAPAEPPKS